MYVGSFYSLCHHHYQIWADIEKFQHLKIYTLYAPDRWDALICSLFLLFFLYQNILLMESYSI